MKELTVRQALVLEVLRRRHAQGRGAQTAHDMADLKDPQAVFSYQTIGYDRAHGALNSLVKKGLAERLPVRPATYRPTQEDTAA